MARRVYDRPGKPLPEKRAINIRIMPELFGELCRAAEEAGRPVAVEALLRIERSFEKRASAAS